MNNRRRRVLRAVGIALVPAIAGCAEQSGSDETGSGGEQTSTSVATETTASDTETTATTEPRTETETSTPSSPGEQTDTETTTRPETETPTSTETTTPDEGTTSSDTRSLVLNNVGVRAWEVTDDESGSVAPPNEDNPTLSFEVGQRYAVENRGWSVHPFALRAADDSPLLSQAADGSFEDVDAVDWTDNGETFAFTFTEDLAAEVDYYICTVHSGMRGTVDSI
jgi:hypothetical protein